MDSIDGKITRVFATMDGWQSSLDIYLSAGPSSPVNLSRKSHFLSKNYVAKEGEYKINVFPLLQSQETMLSLSQRIKDEGGFEDFNSADLEGFREVMNYVNNMGIGYHQIIEFEKGKSTAKAKFYREPGVLTPEFEKEKKEAAKIFLESFKEAYSKNF